MSSSTPIRPERDARLDRVGAVARVAVHLRGEGAGRDRADDDVLLRQPQRHAPGQLDQAGLARGVRIGFLRVDRDAVDRGDVDHLGRPLGARRLAQRPGERLGQEERRLQVQVDDLVPALLGKAVEVLAPGRAGVVDQDVERRLVLARRRRRAPARPARRRRRPAARRRCRATTARARSRRRPRPCATRCRRRAHRPSGSRRRSCGRCRASRR